MEEEARLPLEREVAKDLLSKSLRRTYGGAVDVVGYRAQKLSNYHGKSRVYKVHLDLEFPGRTFEVSPVVVMKVYKTDNPENATEFGTENRILQLSEDLVCNVSETERVRVYPRSFSYKVDECITYHTIIREYIDDKSLLQTVLDSKKNSGKVKWDDIKGTISSLALLHINTPWLQGKLELRRYDLDYLSDNLVKHLERLSLLSGAKQLESSQRKNLKGLLQSISLKYLFDSELIKVINGDLGVCPHHATKTILLDAGSTFVGPFTEDLALYSDPIFEGARDSNGKKMNLCKRGQETISEYLIQHERFSENLGFSNDIEQRLSRDFLLASFLVSTVKGSIRAASSALFYKGKDLLINEDGKVPAISWAPRLDDTSLVTKEYLEREAQEYIENVYTSVSLLKERDKQSFGRLEESLLKVLPRKFKIKRNLNSTDFKRHPRNPLRARKSLPHRDTKTKARKEASA